MGLDQILAGSILEKTIDTTDFLKKLCGGFC